MKLDEFIKKSQIQTNSANDAYLEWIPLIVLMIGDMACTYVIYLLTTITMQPLN